MKIAFIGLGTMGLPMARNCIENGHDVVGFDLNSTALENHVANGGTVAQTGAEAATDADLIVTMVPNASHVRAALFEPDGILDGMDSSALVIEMSTIHPLESDGIREKAASRGFALIDGPVGRTSMHAQSGQLLIMAGGTKSQIKQAGPVFDSVGDTVIDCGGPGMGIRMKMINNFMSIVNNVVTAEALTLAESIGLDVNMAVDVMSGTAAGQGHMSTTYQAKALQGDLTPAFMLELAHKDLGLALDLAAQVQAPVPMGAAAREMYTIARRQGRGQQDWTAIYEGIRELAGLEHSK
ncbi:MAG: sulfolactaldehyde 3-reductase [Chloroflexota bacterium]